MGNTTHIDHILRWSSSLELISWPRPSVAIKVHRCAHLVIYRLDYHHLAMEWWVILGHFSTATHISRVMVDAMNGSWRCLRDASHRSTNKWSLKEIDKICDYVKLAAEIRLLMRAIFTHSIVCLCVVSPTNLMDGFYVCVASLSHYPWRRYQSHSLGKHPLVMMIPRRCRIWSIDDRNLKLRVSCLEMIATSVGMLRDLASSCCYVVATCICCWLVMTRWLNNSLVWRIASILTCTLYKGQFQIWTYVSVYIISIIRRATLLLECSSLNTLILHLNISYLLIQLFIFQCYLC